MNRTLRALSPMLLVAALGACAHAADDRPTPLTPTEQYAIDVRQVPEQLSISPSPHGLTPEQQAQVAELAARWRDSGGAPILVRTPEGVGDPRLAQSSVEAVLRALAQHGVPAGAVQVAGYDARGAAGGAPVVVAFNRFEAVVPDCSDRWDSVTDTFAARPSAAFGCAVTANMAAMIAEPRDLTSPRTMTPTDAARRQTMLDNYRRGDPTGSRRSAEESSRVSEALSSD